MPELAVVSMSWIDAAIGDAVRRVASSDPDPTDPFRGLYVTDAAAVETADGLDGSGFDARLAHAAELLSLDPLDAALLGLCAAPVLDARYARLVGYLHDDLARRLPSPRLLARLLAAEAPPETVLARLAAGAPLRRGGVIALLDEAEGTPAVDRLLALDEQLAAVLLGAGLATDTLADELRDIAPDTVLAGVDAAAGQLARALAAAGDVPLLCAGADAERLLAQALGCHLVVLDAARLDDERLLARARLRATLTGGRVAVAGLEELTAEERATLHRRLAAPDGPRLLCARRPRVPTALAGVAHATCLLPPPGAEERARQWAARLPGAELGDVPAAFALGGGQIEHAAGLARAEARIAGRASPSCEDVRAAARRVARRDLEQHATPLAAPYSWEDLVLGDEGHAQLRAIVARLRHRSLVLGTWGFGRRVAPAAGLRILFAGESGTGKTLATQVLANALGLDLYRVDLSRTVSKFIGETEKSLARLFDAAEDASAVLFFDEADALFGKRTAVGDAHDRYANLEVAYLLQRIEQFAGAVVLATNLRRNLDQAFLRRLDFVVDFPLPDRDRRRALWERHLPAEAPLAGDVDLDALAEHGLPGGSIRNCVLHAAFAAAQDGIAIRAAHLDEAVRLEQRKLGRLAIPPQAPA